MSYKNHARRHLPGGTDPIPGLAPSFAHIYTSTAKTVNAGSQLVVAWDGFDTNDETVFATVPAAGNYSSKRNTSGDSLVLLMKQGLYLVRAGTSWESGTYDRFSFINVPAGTIVGWNGDVETPEQGNKSTTTAGQDSPNATPLQLVSERILFQEADNFGELFLLAGNLDSSAHTVSADLGIFFWPIPGLTDQIVSVY